MRDLTRLWKVIANFFRQHWIGAVLVFVATLVFFWPMVMHISSYSEGGDAMFNAWTLSRDHNCIVRDGCPSYVDGNIFFPHKDTMLYSETQLSAGLLTLPLHWINQNPIFAYNVWTMVSFFLMGFFMYLLAKYLSKDNETISVLAGLIFAFSPFRMPAIFHLQNISIFYLPLAFLLIFKYLETKRRGYLIPLLLTLILQFYASWYQMVFVLIALGILLAGLWLLKLERFRSILPVTIVIVVALLSTYPLAKEYMRFSKTNEATFSIENQAQYSAALIDYIVPEPGTPLGKAIHQIRPSAHLGSYNPDSNSYYGLVLYGTAAFVLVMAFRNRKRGIKAIRQWKTALIFAAIGVAGFIISLGPLLKFRSSYIHHFLGSTLDFAIPLPYVVVDKVLPQLSFIRALGRGGVLLLFALCCLLALAPFFASKSKFYGRHKRPVNFVVVALIVIELMPLHLIPMRTTDYSYNLSIPPVYEYVKSHEDVNNIIILSGDWDYPDAGIPIKLPEQVLWAGYHNKNIFNGYSGYLPPDYYPKFYDYVDFQKDDVPKLKQDNLRYVLVDKQLSTTRPNLANDVSSVLGSDHKVYEDKRYVLFKV